MASSIAAAIPKARDGVSCCYRIFLATCEHQSMETIGTRVKALRLGLRLSQTELAKRVEIAQPSLTNIEKGAPKR